MRQVHCGECGKRYDYDEDGFCPKCGAFNQPRRRAAIGADGSVVRTDGLNEQNHAGSFVHQELHREKRTRRNLGLDKSVQRIKASTRPPAVNSSWTQGSGKPRAEKLKAIGWAILALLLLLIKALRDI